MMRLESGRLSGYEKAAALLITLGPDLSSAVMKHFSEVEVERLTTEIVRMETVREDVKEQVLEESYEVSMAQRYLSQGGEEYARELLVKAFGPDKAEELIARLAEQRVSHPFDFIRHTDPTQLSSFLHNEHPQTIALVLAHLDASQAAAILALLPPELQGEVGMRLASMDRTAPDVISELAKALRKKLSVVLSQEFSRVGGLDYLVKVLQKADRSTERVILEWLDEYNHDLSENIRRKMFVFENLVNLDNQSIQRVLRETDQRDLALALKGASEELRTKVFSNLSSRAAAALNEELSLLGPVRLRVVEEAQQRIVELVRRLEQAEEIVIERGEEQILV